MTNWESRILALFAERFPSSAAASGGRVLRLSCRRAFPELVSARPDIIESFLEGAENLERAGIISLDWERHRKGESLVSFSLVDPSLLFASLGRPSPSDTCARAREEARRIASDETSGETPGETVAFFRWAAEVLSPEDAAAGIDGPSLRALNELLDALAAHSNEGTLAFITPRALSVKLFSDSKRIESLLRLLQPLLARACRAGHELSLLSAIDRSFPDTLVAGKLSFSFPSGTLINESGSIIGLPYVTLRRISDILVLPPEGARSFAGKKRRVLGIENKETFFALALSLSSGVLEDFDALVYVGGHPNRAVQCVWAAFAFSGFALSHSGDLNPDGLLILQELGDAARRPVEPFFMDAATFDRYASQSRPLDASMLCRASQLRDDTRSLSGIEDLLTRILRSGRGVEQEIISYERK